LETKNNPLERYLGRVRPHLPLMQSRDILLELESTIRDRVDDLAHALGRDPDEDMFDLVCSEMGEPEQVASGFVTERHLIGPGEYRPFLFYTGLLFALHMVLIGIATALARPLAIGPVSMAPVVGTGFFGMVATAVSALFLDIGLMVVVFSALGATKRFRTQGPTLRVECSRRIAFGSAIMSLLVAVVLNFFRDGVFVVVGGEETYPLFTPEFANRLPLVTALLVGAAIKEIGYGLLGETRSTLLTDALHGVFGVAIMLYLLRGDALLALPSAEAFEAFHGSVNAFLVQLTNLVVALLAFGFGWKTVKRLLRSAQM
jgi:hypothetical protein